MIYQRYTPRRPIKSFQDLEVYQKLLAVSVVVAKRVPIHNAPLPKLSEVDNKSLPTIASKLIQTALDLPLKIATAHSLRFTDQPKAIAILEEVMLNCNVLIVYLEQYRDIENTIPVGIESATPACAEASAGRAAGNEIGTEAIENEFFEEQIGTLTTCRWKVMHLARSWEKFKQTQ